MEQEELQCNLGTVLNMSATGMCVRARKRPADTVQVIIFSMNGDVIVDCEVVRANRIRFLTYDVGLRFLDPDPETIAALAEIVRCHRFRRTM